MKILLDERVPWPLHKLLIGHDCTTAQKQGWGGITNGDLLRLVEAAFDLFITADQNIRYQQNLTGRRIRILQLSTNDLRRIQAAVTAIQPGEFNNLDILNTTVDWVKLGLQIAGVSPINRFHLFTRFGESKS